MTEEEKAEQYDRMLAKLARLLGKQPGGDSDALLRDALDDAMDVVKNYCNITEIPRELESTVVKMARDVWRAEGYGQDTPAASVASVSRGDVSVSYTSGSGDNYSDANNQGGAGFARAYQKILNSFRVLR